MAGGSGQGPRPSSLYPESRDGSPPPPYSPWPTQQQKQQQKQTLPNPPAYHSGASRVGERTPLLPRSQYDRGRVTTTRETFTRDIFIRERWTARWHRGYRNARRRSRACAQPCTALPALLTTLLFSGVALFVVAFGLYTLWQWGMSAWPRPAPLPTYSVAVIGISAFFFPRRSYNLPSDDIKPD